MGFWAEIKHALNSTLGTKEFKPLDKIIRDSYYVYASDDLLKTLYDETFDGSNTNVDLTTIGTIGLPGTIKLRIEVDTSGSGGSNTSRMYVGVEGNLKTIDISNGEVTTYVLIDAKKGDKIQFRFEVNYYLRLHSIKIAACGKIGSAPDTGIFIE